MRLNEVLAFTKLLSIVLKTANLILTSLETETVCVMCEENELTF